MLDRKQLKSEARGDMSGRNPSVFLVALAYIAILFVLEALSYKVLYPGMSLSEIFNALVDQSAVPESTSFISQIFDLAISVMSMMIGVGFTIYCLNVSRGMQAGFGHLFDAFGMFFRMLWLNILIWVFTALWTCLLIIPGIIAFYRYSMAIYILIDNPELPAMECINRSKEMTDGYKTQLFVLDLSFIGWALLSCIPFVSIYTLPYFTVTKSKYYNVLSGYTADPDVYHDSEINGQP